MVEIARALRSKAKVVIFDEPTASLTPEESLHLFDVIAGLTASGVGVIFVSHALEESLQISDRVTVLRDGEHVVTVNTVRGQQGRHRPTHGRTRRRESARASRPPAPMSGRRPVLEVENLILGNDREEHVVLRVRRRSAGHRRTRSASGRTETAKIVAGEMKRNRTPRRPGAASTASRCAIESRSQAIDDGIVYITEDRKLNGFFETMTDRGEPLPRPSGLEGRAAGLPAVAEEAEGFAKDVVSRSSRSSRSTPTPRSSNSPVATSRRSSWRKSLVQDPDVVIFDEPTRGVDVGAIEEIHQLIRTLGRRGQGGHRHLLLPA